MPADTERSDTRLLTEPLWRPEDLGRPIPDSPHAVSACLPTWADNIGYEEHDPRVMQKLTTGYPRFVYNALCRRLFAECEARFAAAGETCLAFPSQRAANRCAEFIERRADVVCGVHEFGFGGIFATSFPQDAAAHAKASWQHCGEGISSRQAAAALEGHMPADSHDARIALRHRIATAAGVPVSHVWLCPTGMNALFVLHRALLSTFSDRKSVQFGFPYVDSLKLQQCYGAGVHFYPGGNSMELDQLRVAAADEQFSAIYTELPTNPLLASPDLLELRNIADAADCPLVVDDTVSSSVNVDVLPIVDVAWSSLTKFFSGVGDVIGGVIIVNPDRCFADRIQQGVEREWEDLMWSEDAAILDRNSRDFEARVRTINGTAEKLAEFLRVHPRVERVYFPKFESRAEYDSFKKPHGGYGGLLSVDLRNAPEAAPRFYDALQICKGPNLGMNYSLACPFTILAHYHELDFAERCGVSQYLVRVSVGLEPAEELIERFDAALRAV